MKISSAGAVNISKAFLARKNSHTSASISIPSTTSSSLRMQRRRGVERGGEGEGNMLYLLLTDKQQRRTGSLLESDSRFVVMH